MKPLHNLLYRGRIGRIILVVLTFGILWNAVRLGVEIAFGISPDSLLGQLIDLPLSVMAIFSFVVVIDRALAKGHLSSLQKPGG